MLMAIMVLCLVGCKDQNEPSNNGTATGVKNEFGEGRLIIGSWKTSYSAATNYYFRFHSDGTCGYSYGNKGGEGYWSYDPETKTLASTISFIGSMKINIMTPKALQGTTTSGKNFGLEHSTSVDTNKKLIIGKWVNENNTKEYVFNGTNYTLTINGYKQTGTYNIQTGLYSEKHGYHSTITLGETTYILQNLQGGYFSYRPFSGNTSTHEEFYYVSE